jgi:alpha-tubulin suppressor-like RCC1 family protein
MRLYVWLCGLHPGRLTRRLVPLFIVAALACREDAKSTTEPDEVAAPLAGAGQALAFLQVSAGNSHTCGVTMDNRAYCWGFGLLGNGSTYSQRLTPVAVAGGHRFSQISSGIDHTCGVTITRQAYCWGGNSSGQLGNGSTSDRMRPTPVAGGRRFRHVDAGSFHTCGVTYPDNLAYCWGSNSKGKLGDGTTTDRLTPVPTARGLRFRRVSAGWNHSCGVTTDDQAFCWGSNREGQVGDGSELNRRQRPVAVAGGRLFRQVDAGLDYTCAVTVDDRAFCWGDGRFGQIGDGSTSASRSPVAVAGGRRFVRVSTGTFHACAETEAKRAFCWGHNLFGSLGDGTTNLRKTPVAVSGGLNFSQVSAGSFFACGVTPTRVAYCWGDNSNGQLGDGSRVNRSTPRKVAGAT